MKQKRVLFILTMLCAILLQAFSVSAITSEAAGKGRYFTSGRLYYHTLSGKKVEVCGTTQTSGTLTIPATVTYKGTTYTVTKIADHKLYTQDTAVTEDTSDGSSVALDLPGYHSYRYDRADGKEMPSKVEWLSGAGISKLVLPDTLTDIGEGAFAGCTKLKTVEFAKKYKKLTIGKNAFGGNKIKSLVFPKGTYELKENAAGTASSITIPSSVKKIGAGVVNASTKKVTNKSKKYTFKSGILYSKDGKTLVGVSAKAGSSIKISAKTTKIGEKAFAGTNVKTVTLSSKITSIPKGAFYGCEKLETVSGTDAVTEIGYAAFADCPKLTAIGNTGKLAKVARAVFWGDNKLAFTITESLKDIDAYAFSGTLDPTRAGVSVAQGNPFYSIEGNFLIKTDGTQKTVIMQTADADQITVPEGVTDVAVAVGGDSTSVTFPATLSAQEGKIYVNGGTICYKAAAVPKFGAEYDISTGGKNTAVVVPKGTLQGYQKAISDVVRARDDYEIWEEETLSIKEQ